MHFMIHHGLVIDIMNKTDFTCEDDLNFTFAAILIIG